MDKQEKALFAVQALEQEYPEGICSLEAADPFQLLVATRLSAQCTDARVNLVTPALFARFGTPQAMAGAEVTEIEELIRSCGFFHTKARDLVAMAGVLVRDYNGRVPDTIEALTALPGVGRKTANLICGDVYRMPSAVVADTHLIRITNLLGLVHSKDPYKVELALREILPPDKSNDFCHRCVLHGRAVCIARRPHCAKCCLRSVCDAAVTENGRPTE